MGQRSTAVAADCEPSSVNSINRNFHTSDAGSGVCPLLYQMQLLCGWQTTIFRQLTKNIKDRSTKVCRVQIFLMSAKKKNKALNKM